MDNVTNAFADRRRTGRLSDHYKCSLSRGIDMTTKLKPSRLLKERYSTQRKFRMVCRLQFLFFFGVVVDYFYKSH